MMSDTGTGFDLAGSRSSVPGAATAHRQHYCQLRYVHHYVHHCLMHCLVHGANAPAMANAQLDGPKLDPCDDLGSVL
ncbi:Uncharacterised protein [Mycobacteroides abscessus]|uniref:Uncharacterized protein n=1 Tax=Mycobacteroides abscessus subsp. massiliense TaxID=1962118 RepID=A0AB38DHT0_9MYCO|nr:Uncharacterised protein [Mycobacteroides abscessus]SKD21209.1 Uncharacterised protein [Mycobacteroides abscessus subsp. massiliense]CPS51627.1 Uncharacterised protein [Mycobacteroides abscessus]CPT09894.1 Uncharacterised protein [Mycobacteroides abscessus]CPT74843.1 Uncharacterised protein [Mycobacteroides abscessus]